MLTPSHEALDSFERQTAWPMLVLSLTIIPLLVIPLVADLSPATERTLFAIDAGCREPQRTEVRTIGK